ncbi:NUDIX domain-containing protein [Rossellomorea vietnamensis]|uniref:NUDIX domain-containing protein n=1 Tax=Rossellomorea vietnamensis TaxID=218284 RepID=A0A6I6UJR6_9BACI|nr:NUDIX hydrolase [Rossellomorea vietnamensis]QHE61627.1 NUDIX domain-containing protein [Rossellomorea vietnamensis]
MNEWKGASALCMNEGRLLMVLQGKEEEEKRWSVPSGGLEKGETLRECCKREVWEETGYRVDVGKHLYTKWGCEGKISTTIHYYEVQLLGGVATLQDPDQLIHRIEWISLQELKDLPLGFPEDQSILEAYMSKKHNIL